MILMGLRREKRCGVASEVDIVESDGKENGRGNYEVTTTLRDKTIPRERYMDINMHRSRPTIPYHKHELYPPWNKDTAS